MTAEILVAIALLCQANNNSSSLRVYDDNLKCQKEYIDCVKVKTEDVNLIAKALANCIKDKK